MYIFVMVCYVTPYKIRGYAMECYPYTPSRMFFSLDIGNFNHYNIIKLNISVLLINKNILSMV